MSAPKQTHIRKIALIGGSGNLGSHILSSLLALSGPPSITVLARPSSTATYPHPVTVVPVDYASPSSISAALSGHDFLIITLSTSAPPDLHSRIVNAAADAGVKYVMPNYFGYALGSVDVTAEPIIGAFDKWVEDCRSVEEKGVKWVALVCGFWYEWSVGMGEQWLGFDIQKKKVTMYGDGTRKINTSTWELCGRAVAGLVSLPLESDEGKPAVADWEKKGLHVSSFLVSQRDILDSLHRVLGTSDADWTISYQPAEERYAEGLEELGEGKMTGFAKALYARLFFPDGRGDYETGRELDNAKLGIGKEQLDVATKRTVDMVNGGFGIRE